MADSAAECGLRSFWIMAGAMDRRKVVSHLLAYEGPFGVGYGTAIFEPGERDEGRAILDLYEQEQREQIANLRAGEDAHLALARASLEHFVKRHEYLPVPADLPPALQGRHGAFVSIKKDGALRGCIGTFLPTRDNLAQEIIYNAVSAGLNDPRFSQVTEAELPELVYDVDVLTEPEPIDSPAKLDVRRYGVIVQAGNRRGLLLPDLEGVDTVEQQISIARRKGNIGEKEKVQLYRFEVERHV
jgi:AmmeMemoRadiSam system protein A